MANPKGQTPPAREPAAHEGAGLSDTVHDLPTFSEGPDEGRPPRRTEHFASPRAEPPTLRRPPSAEPPTPRGTVPAEPPAVRRPAPAGSHAVVPPAEAPPTDTLSGPTARRADVVPTARIRPAPVAGGAAMSPNLIPDRVASSEAPAPVPPTVRTSVPADAAPPARAARVAPNLLADSGASSEAPAPVPPTLRTSVPADAAPPARAARVAPTLLVEAAPPTAGAAHPSGSTSAPDLPFRTAPTVAMEVLSEPAAAARAAVQDVTRARPSRPGPSPAPSPLDEPVTIARATSSAAPRRQPLDGGVDIRPAPGGGALAVVPVVLIGLAFVLPTAEGPPWERVLYPTGATFHALALLLTLAALSLARPVGRGLAVGQGVVALLGLGLAWLSMRDAVAADLFDAQPALGVFWGGAGLIGASAALGGAAVIGAAAARGQGSRVPAAIAFAAGALLLLLPALITPVEGHGTALAGLISSLGGTQYRGDRVAAFALLPGLVVIVAALPLLRPGLLQRGGAILAMLVLAGIGAPLIALALHVAPSAAGEQILAPLKAVLLWVGAVGVGGRAVMTALSPRSR